MVIVQRQRQEGDGDTNDGDQRFVEFWNVAMGTLQVLYLSECQFNL